MFARHLPKDLLHRQRQTAVQKESDHLRRQPPDRIYGLLHLHGFFLFQLLLYPAGRLLQSVQSATLDDGSNQVNSHIQSA